MDASEQDARDIAEQIATEDRYRQKSHALDLVHDAVVALDSQGHITYLNLAAQQFYGWSSEEAVGRLARSILVGEKKEAFDEAWQQLREVGSWRGELAQVTKHGEDRLVESRWSTLQEKQSSRITAILMVSSDIDDLKSRRPASKRPSSFSDERRRRPGEAKRGRPQRQTNAPLGNLILNSMNLLELSYKDIVSESERLARLHSNSDMRIGKSTLGNIISGSIRQPGTAKLDSLRIILNIARADMDAAIGLQPERRFAEQLEMTRARTHEVPIDAVTRQRKIKIPILRDDAELDDTQFFEGSLQRWSNIEVEYLGSFYPPYLAYVVVGEEDTNASPIAPPGSRLLINKLLTKVYPADNVSFHERELFYVLTPNGLTCVYLELAAGNKIVLIPHPVSGHVREEFQRDEVKIIGQVVGVLYPA